MIRRIFGPPFGGATRGVGLAVLSHCGFYTLSLVDYLALHRHEYALEREA
jgi:hypothetical protein